MISAKFIRPAEFKARPFRQNLHAATLPILSEMILDFEKTTRTWKRQPVFVGKSVDHATDITAEVTTTNKIYKFIDKGTRKHKIPKVPKRKGFLAYNSKFTAKTTPNLISSKAGSSGGPVFFAKQVTHPGTKARNFTKVISKKWQPKLRDRVQKAIAKAVRESGHSAT